MSSFYSDASLIVIPSGYKASKVYSAVPTDGSGDLVFTRSNDTATRVNSAGLIEKVRTNLLLQSNTFNTTWSTTGSSVTSGQAGYDGTSNAWLLTRTGTSGYLEQSLVQSTLGVVSVYAKANANNWFRIRVSATASSSAFYDLSNGTLGTFTSGQIATITSVGNGWYRCTLTYSPTSSNIRIYVADADNDVSGSSGSVFIQAAQWELGDIATPYIPTTTAAVSVGPVANVPRLDYLGSSCPRLLLEPQRTNSITSSESTATGWTFTNSSSAVNQTASPDGYVNADSIIPDATSGQHAINSVNITASGSFTLSAFVKAGEYTKVAIRESANTGSYASFNLATGTKIEDNVSGASFIQSYGNGWYRIGVTGTYSGSIRLGINVLSNAYTTGNPSSGTTFFSGNASDKLFCWGMQAELGATYATSYIPTLAASVTRGADACVKTGISSLIGQTEGVLFVDFVAEQPSEVRRITLSDGTSANRILIGHQADGTIQFFIAVGSASQVSFNTSASYTKGTRLKIAFAYKANDFAAYINGAQVLTDNSGTVPASSKFAFADAIDTNPLISTVNQALLFKTRLPNSELASLTNI